MTITNNKQHHNYIIVLCFVSIKKERIFYPLSFINLEKIILKRVLSRSKCRSDFTTFFIKPTNHINALLEQSEWRDLNPRPLPPQGSSCFFWFLQLRCLRALSMLGGGKKLRKIIFKVVNLS